MSRATLVASAGLAALLATILIVEYYALRPEDSPLTTDLSRLPQAASVPLGVPAGPTSETQARVTGILARPMFSASRRPPGAASAGSAPAALPRLTAVLVSARGKTVIFAGGQDARPVTLGEGGRIGAYVVQSIGAGQVTLMGPDGPRVVRPAFASQGVAAGAAPLSSPPSIVDLLRQGTPVLGFPVLTGPGAATATPAPR